MQFNTFNKPYVSAIKYIFILLPAIAYYITISQYAVNVPSQDDYEAILRFLNDYSMAHGMQKAALLLRQHNEHRILSSRIIFLLYYKVFGHINFRHLILIGNLQLVLIFTITTAFIKRNLPHHWAPAAFITGLCLFDLNNWENADFAMAGMQNYGVIFLFIASLYLFTFQDRKYSIAGFLLLVLCIYSSGNGMVACGIVMIYTLFSGDRFSIVLSSIALVVFCPLYFICFKAPDTAHPVLDITRMSVYFLRFISCFTVYKTSFLAAAVALLLLTGFAVVLPWSRKKPYVQPTALPLVVVFVFLMATIILTTIFRYSMGDYPAIRYYIYAHFLLAVFFIFLFMKLKDRKISYPVSVASMCLILWMYMSNRPDGIAGYVHLQTTLTGTDYYYPGKDAAKEISDKSCELNIYCIDKERQPQKAAGNPL